MTRIASVRKVTNALRNCVLTLDFSFTGAEHVATSLPNFSKRFGITNLFLGFNNKALDPLISKDSLGMKRARLMQDLKKYFPQTLKFCELHDYRFFSRDDLKQSLLAEESSEMHQKISQKILDQYYFLTYQKPPLQEVYNSAKELFGRNQVTIQTYDEFDIKKAHEIARILRPNAHQHDPHFIQDLLTLSDISKADSLSILPFNFKSLENLAKTIFEIEEFLYHNKESHEAEILRKAFPSMPSVSFPIRLPFLRDVVPLEIPISLKKRTTGLVDPVDITAMNPQKFSDQLEKIFGDQANSRQI